MTLLPFLRLQPIDDDDVETPDIDDTITLKEEINEADLDAFWNQVMHDIHEDPDWFKFESE